MQPNTPTQSLKALLIITAVMLLYYGGLLLKWMQTLPGDGADALKNFYTLAWHVEHGDSAFWFKGMNYPFGEHIFFTDNQPVLAVFLQIINFLLPIEDHLHALLPLILMASFIAGAWFIYKLFAHNNAPFYINALFAAAIMLLSPQWMRIAGHFSLAHGFVIPMLLYGFLKYQQRRSLWLLMLTPLIGGLLHPYFLAMSALASACFLVIHNILFKRLSLAKTWLHIVLVPAIPLLIFQSLLWLTDPVADRPENPYGFLVYRATWSSIFLPIYQTYGQWITAAYSELIEKANEGSFYIGLFGTLGFAWVIFVHFFKLFKKTTLSENDHLATSIALASLPLLLLSAGFPFTHWRFEGLLDYLGPLRQFRGIGRFSFVFFYAANVSAALILLHRYHDSGRWFRLVIVASLAIIFTEAWFVRQNVQRHSTGGMDTFSPSDENMLEVGFCDAIHPIPFYHTGSENFRTEGEPQIIGASMALSLQTGLPLTAVHMSRTSLSQSMQSLAMAGEPLAPVAAFDSLSSDTWLIMVDPKVPLFKHQQLMLDHSSKLGAWRGFDLYAFAVSQFKSLRQKWLYNHMVAMTKSIIINDLTKIWRDLGVYYHSFDTNQSDRAFSGSGALQVKRSDWTPLIPKNTPLQLEVPFELSFWFYAGDQHAVNTQIWFWERATEEEIGFYVREVGDYTRAVYDDWILVAIPINPQRSNSQFEILLHRDGEKMDIWIDEVLLRPVNQNVHTTTSANLMNNRSFKLTSVK